MPDAVQVEVQEHLGKAFIEHVYTHSNAERGKPPLRGWEREKRRRMRVSLAGRELNNSA